MGNTLIKETGGQENVAPLPHTTQQISGKAGGKTQRVGYWNDITWPEMKVSIWDRELALGHGEAVEGRTYRCGKSQAAVTEGLWGRRD